ncbi:hypothetical protein [Scytonema sp. NUACC26]|uniref:hypothetical protein n=1 Tax=Scytonema sp. NUACC26 TaxID=3140176 RepID=UPI0038B334D5
MPRSPKVLKRSTALHPTRSLSVWIFQQLNLTIAVRRCTVRESDRNLYCMFHENAISCNAACIHCMQSRDRLTFHREWKVRKKPHTWFF